ncbi:Hypp1403 [Branchiostoma lanceolatum]|uniref:Hypp1403 protein n=1 Tax=Branchiostoma lanceolatum TaxID=7740 RepID=A0A8J9ZHH5_BRALA|nr:Hypp1403 [Branchiostoma lanceolatum]
MASVQMAVPLGTPTLGVLIYPSQLLRAELSGQGPTCFLRKLMDLFFTRDVLANSSLRGLGKHGALDEDIMAAIISATLQKFPTKCDNIQFCNIVDNKCAKARQYLAKQKAKPRCFPDSTL